MTLRTQLGLSVTLEGCPLFERTLHYTGYTAQKFHLLADPEQSLRSHSILASNTGQPRAGECTTGRRKPGVPTFLGAAWVKPLQAWSSRAPRSTQPSQALFGNLRSKALDQMIQRPLCGNRGLLSQPLITMNCSRGEACDRNKPLGRLGQKGP